jgi:GT2 family glycosyltransferase
MSSLNKVNFTKISPTTQQKLRQFGIVTIVVTYNRKDILIKCIDLLFNQTMATDILIVDNASDDGTEIKLKHTGLIDEKRIHYIQLNRNVGGAGGFYYGLKYAIEKGWQWFWLMDDDAEPRIDALEKLFEQVNSCNHLYASAAVSNMDGGKKLCFPTKKITQDKLTLIENHHNLAKKERVLWLPFLGFLIHKELVEKIGFPDKNLFIRNDDIEYCEKSKTLGIRLFLIKESIIDHPFQPTIPFNILGWRLYYRSMPSWKMYYEVRNKIIIAKRYHTILTGLKSLAGATLQFFLSIFIEEKKSAYVESYSKGLVDGLRHILQSKRND